MRWWYQMSSFSEGEPQAKPAAWRWDARGHADHRTGCLFKKSYSKFICASNCLILTGESYKLLRRHSSVLLRCTCWHQSGCCDPAHSVRGTSSMRAWTLSAIIVLHVDPPEVQWEMWGTQETKGHHTITKGTWTMWPQKPSCVFPVGKEAS